MERIYSTAHVTRVAGLADIAKCVDRRNSALFRSLVLRINVLMMSKTAVFVYESTQKRPHQFSANSSCVGSHCFYCGSLEQLIPKCPFHHQYDCIVIFFLRPPLCSGPLFPGVTIVATLIARSNAQAVFSQPTECSFLRL